MITENLKDVEARVCAACERSGRKREDVTLIAVSKTKPVEIYCRRKQLQSIQL